VRVIPVPVRAAGPVPRRRPLHHRPPQHRPGEPVRFLFAFDFNSGGQRKNPWGLVEAFHRAFPGEADMRLTIKAINAHRHPLAPAPPRPATDET